MSIGNHGFHPSQVEDRIYDLMELSDNIAGMDSYTNNLLVDVCEMMRNEFSYMEWEAFSVKNDKGGYTMSFAWVEHGHIHLIGWDIMEEPKC